MNAKILIAHGNVLMADVFREVLAREGCRVMMASDGHRALGLALSDEYDLLLIDRDLPGLDGERVLEVLQARGSLTPVITTLRGQGVEALRHLRDPVGPVRGGGADRRCGGGPVRGPGAASGGHSGPLPRLRSPLFRARRASDAGRP
ncbi:MAG: response regulator [Candidatus Latescibacteria bacterium]|nr:response regulator [Candidatus Latescibacterota bacterium]